MADDKANAEALTEPIIINQFWRNRSGQAIRVSLQMFKEKPLLDIRTWWIGKDGKLHPGKGFSCRLVHLRNLAGAVNKALEKAEELGLIDKDAAR